jgi:hypothetical protein
MSSDSTAQAIETIRNQLAGMLSQIDSSAQPRPDEVNPPDHKLPGPVWHPDKDWVVRCVDDDDPGPGLPCIYITPPHLYHDGDIEAIDTHHARKLAMAILAACDWADGLAQGVTQLDGRRSS